MLITARTGTDPELAALVVAWQRELGAAGHRTDGTPADVRFLVAVVGGRAVACGGLRSRNPGTGELHAVYVRPAYRGRGIARQLLATLEELAFQAGHVVVCRGTGSSPGGAAGFWTACGYEPVRGCGGHAVGAYTRCFAKRLPVAA
ncbi:GNAT family N-acetyltransferase [Micromonospora sp. NPDC049799]|uniref:GNAT family N-acetyltransferase n=1 Tax=Micromonospora sp. NPDC049799 TaxID=3154741 RepID=UPI0033C0FDBE